MSGIAVIYHRDGSPADSAQLDGMMAALSHRGPDGLKRWFNRSVAFGHAMLRTTPESVKEIQPLSDESRTLCLTLDGRVDNFEELADALRAKGARLRCETDAELVLRAYDCWQEESPQRIIGDFAYALWDEKRQRLFCARDSRGVKPLYYYVDDRTLTWPATPTVSIRRTEEGGLTVRLSGPAHRGRRRRLVEWKSFWLCGPSARA